MEISRKWKFSWLLLGLFFLAHSLESVTGEAEVGPSESECRPYIEKALKDLETAETTETEHVDASPEDALDVLTEGSEHDTGKTESAESLEEKKQDETTEQTEEITANTETSTEVKDEQSIELVEESITETSVEGATLENQEITKDEATTSEEQTEQEPSADENLTQEQSLEKNNESIEEQADEPGDSKDTEEKSVENEAKSMELQATSVEEQEASTESNAPSTTEQAPSVEVKEESIEEQGGPSEKQGEASVEENAESVEDKTESVEEQAESAEDKTESVEDKAESVEENAESAEDQAESVEEKADSVEEKDSILEETVTKEESVEGDKDSVEVKETTESVEEPQQENKSIETPENPALSEEKSPSNDETSLEETKEANAAPENITETTGDSENDKKSVEEENEPEEVEVVKTNVDSETNEVEDEVTEEGAESKESLPEEELILGIEVPKHLRPRDHLDQILKLDDDNSELETTFNRVSEVTLRELKRLYENAIKPLETLYKYRDLSNRHFGDSEIFSKPLVLFMGPWSGGKSSIINYLTDNEYNLTSLRSGAEPSPAYFNLVMYGEEPEVLDGTQLAADFTFAGLQKFGQGLEERLRGLKLPNKLLEKINIVEIPGILEVRKQVSRVFPFNDACQWFIDRADIIFLVYDPSKLDVGPETEAILDQLKGREHQTRIVLNKADQVKPEELMRVQSALIWNISPLMSSAQPPAMYTTSLWSRPYESWAPVRLLQAQEREFLRDLRTAIDKRIENKIASARRFAVRVRNHAKMVDCYLTTYYNHKSVFGNRKQVADQIIEHPQDYHIYEGLSTLTNISRYDLPDPDVYRDFFRLNPLYEFQQLSATCTYFRGCPINRLDVAIAYDLPELVGKHKKLLEAAVAKIKTES